VSDYGIWIAILTALVACLIGSVHYALHHFSRSRLEELLRTQDKSHRLEYLRELNGFILLTSVLRASANLVILLAMLAFFVPPNEVTNWVNILWAFLVAGALIAVFSVAIPHSWGRHAPEALLATNLPVLHIVHSIARPIMAPLQGLDPLVRRLLGVPAPGPDDTSELEQEIMDVVSEGEKTGLVDQQQAHMIEAVVEFTDTTVEEIMTPRTDVRGIEVEADLDQVKLIAREAGHSRFPVYDDSLDNIVGVLYVKDLLPLVGANGVDVESEFKLREVVRPALFVPETKTLRDLLAEMQQRKVHMALCLDEYGGTAGLVTIEDILEEIVGEIQDEYELEEKAEPDIVRVDETTAEADGRAYIDDVNDALEIELPEDEDYDTIGGFVFAQLGHVPEVGESFDYEHLQITVLDAEKTKVNRVKIEQREQAAAEARPSESESPSGK